MRSLGFFGTSLVFLLNTGIVLADPSPLSPAETQLARSASLDEFQLSVGPGLTCALPHTSSTMAEVFCLNSETRELSYKGSRFMAYRRPDVSYWLSYSVILGGRQCFAIDAENHVTGQQEYGQFPHCFSFSVGADGAPVVRYWTYLNSVSREIASAIAPSEWQLARAYLDRQGSRIHTALFTYIEGRMTRARFQRQIQMMAQSDLTELDRHARSVNTVMASAEAYCRWVGGEGFRLLVAPEYPFACMMRQLPSSPRLELRENQTLQYAANFIFAGGSDDRDPERLTSRWIQVRAEENRLFFSLAASEDGPPEAELLVTNRSLTEGLQQYIAEKHLTLSPLQLRSVLRQAELAFEWVSLARRGFTDPRINRTEIRRTLRRIRREFIEAQRAVSDVSENPAD